MSERITPEIKPCPDRCPENPAIWDQPTVYESGWWRVSCGACGFHGPRRENRPDAILAWNQIFMGPPVAVAIEADALAHPHGEPGVLPPDLPLDGGKVWFLLPPGKWQPAVLCATGAPEWDRQAVVMALEYGTVQPGQDLSREQQASAIYRERWTPEVPVLAMAIEAGEGD